MSTWASTRLTFLRGAMSRLAIFNETGISTSIQNEIISGKYVPVGYTRDAIRNLYQRTSYKMMKDTGFSANQANRFRAYTPDSVNERLTRVTELIDYLGRGALDQTLAKSGLTLDSGAYEATLESYTADIKKGMQRSTKTYEDWMDYGNFSNR